MSIITLKIITEYNHVKNVKKSCIITINTEQSVEDLKDVVLSELFPNDPKFYRVEEWFNSSTRSKIVFEGAEKIRDLGIQDGSVLMVSIVRGRKSRKCVPDTTELVRLCLAADKRKKAEEKKAQKQAAQKVANGNASKKLKAAEMPGNGIRLGDGEVIRASKKKRSVQKSHRKAADDITDLEDTILGSVGAAKAIDLNDGDIGDLTKGYWRGKMQDTLDEQILLGTDQMQLDCIKTGDYIIEQIKDVNVSGRIYSEIDLKLFKVICKPVGEAKILSTKRIYWSWIFFLTSMELKAGSWLRERLNELRRLVNGSCFIRKRLCWNLQILSGAWCLNATWKRELPIHIPGENSIPGAILSCFKLLLQVWIGLCYKIHLSLENSIFVIVSRYITMRKGVQYNDNMNVWI